MSLQPCRKRNDFTTYNSEKQFHMVLISRNVLGICTGVQGFSFMMYYVGFEVLAVLVMESYNAV